MISDEKEAPEEIYVSSERDWYEGDDCRSHLRGKWSTEHGEDQRYIRADVAGKRIEELEAALIVHERECEIEKKAGDLLRSKIGVAAKEISELTGQPENSVWYRLIKNDDIIV